MGVFGKKGVPATGGVIVSPEMSFAEVESEKKDDRHPSADHVL